MQGDIRLATPRANVQGLGGEEGVGEEGLVGGREGEPPVDRQQVVQVRRAAAVVPEDE
jgi:hypothetical protein